MTTTINPVQPEAVASEGATESKRTRRARLLLPTFALPEGTKLTATPDGFDPDVNRLDRKNFVDIPAWMEHQALMHERRAVKLRANAAEYRINPPKREAGAKKAKLVDRLAKLEAKLAELGINVADLFAN